MKNGHGFTLVELLAAVTIMGILLTIGVISLRNSQIDARDNERQNDVLNIARSLENYYVSNNGSYPSTTVIDTVDKAIDALPGTSPENYRAPGVTTGTSLIMSTNATATTTGVLPIPTTSQYVYQPIDGANTLCTSTTQECRRYNIYHRREQGNLVLMYTGKYR